MGKIHQKPIARLHENDLGCIWGLISMFDFRSIHKFLPERKHGIGRHVGTGYSRSKFDIMQTLEGKPENFIDANQKEAENIILGAVTIQTLLEEEMSGEHPFKKLSSPEVERKRFGGNLEKNHKQRGKNFKFTSDHHANVSRTSLKKTSRSNCANKYEKTSLEISNHEYQEKRIDFKDKNDLPALESNHHDEPKFQLIQKHSILQKAQCDITEVFLNQKSTDAKLLEGNERFYQSKELMAALESPNLNKDLFLKLVQDQDLHLLKHIQELQDTRACQYPEGNELLGKEVGRSSKCEELVRRKSFLIQNAFFWKKAESRGRKPSEGNVSDSFPSLNRIVVLKPNPSRNQGPPVLLSPGSSPRSDHSSQFSLKEIKRRLRHAVGESRKEQLLISADGVVHKTPHGLQYSADIGKRSVEKSIQTGLQSKTARATEYNACSSAKGRDKQAKLKECEPNIEYGTDLSMEVIDNPQYRDLNTGGQNEALPAGQVLNTLGRLLSSTGYTLLSPTCSPGRVMDPESPQKVISSPVKQDIESPPCREIHRDDDSRILDLNPGVLHTHIQLGEHLIPKGNMETIEKADRICVEKKDHVEICSEINSNEEEGTSTFLSCLGPTEERPQLVTSSVSISPSSIFLPKIQVPGTFMESPGSPSPVSVLQPFFLEDISSPGSSTFEHVEYSLQPRQLHFEEDKNFEVNSRTWTENKEVNFEYIRTLLENSGMSYNELSMSKRPHLSDPLLDPSLFDEAQIPWSKLPDDPKLLFDCTNEVLQEIWERFYSWTPWLSIIRPDVRRLGAVGGNLSKEVCEDIERRLDSHSPCTLDQTIKRDLDCGTWINCRRDTESIVFEIGEAILDDLIDERILELLA